MILSIATSAGDFHFTGVTSMDMLERLLVLSEGNLIGYTAVMPDGTLVETTADPATLWGS